MKMKYFTELEQSAFRHFVNSDEARKIADIHEDFALKEVEADYIKGLHTLHCGQELDVSGLAVVVAIYTLWGMDEDGSWQVAQQDVERYDVPVDTHDPYDC